MRHSAHAAVLVRPSNLACWLATLVSVLIYPSSALGNSEPYAAVTAWFAQREGGQIHALARIPLD
ncbi:Uncharacterised protein [Vibrio cholerae]|uniref:Uncharacterized protein n=1 Tax=Vibrio cholerae TaxID=666 RepID=A0A655PL78_VIBCL|nr:Uncharacterised protein [Vibrio cholerae]